MNHKDLIIIALILALIYLYYQNRKQNVLTNFTNSASSQEIAEVKKVNQIFADFCKNEIGGQDINEIRTKLNGRTLAELLEENEDYETTIDGLKRKKGELDAEITLLTNSRKNQVQEKERIITRLKEEKKSLETKYKKKAKQLDEEQCENNKFAEKITSLETKITELTRSKSPLPEKFPKDDQVELEQKHQDQLRAINVLFDENAKDYEVIDFNGLYALLEEEAKKKKKKNSSTSSPKISQKEAVNYSLDNFINWINRDENRREIFQGVDWNFYHSKQDWITSLKKWNTLRVDRTNLLEQWLKEVDNNYD